MNVKWVAKFGMYSYKGCAGVSALPIKELGFKFCRLNSYSKEQTTFFYYFKITKSVAVQVFTNNTYLKTLYINNLIFSSRAH